MPKAQVMARALRCALDPVVFAREMLGFDPDPWQREFLRLTSGNAILNCSRQAGKSTTTALLALHTALYQPKSLILMVSPSLRQSSELFRKVVDFRKQLKPGPKMAEDNRLSCTFDNESRIVALPGEQANVRGFSAPSLVIEDEASQVDDALYAAVRPMLATSGGRLLLLSTPFGRRGHFYEAWYDEDTPWHRIRVTADQCPRISQGFLEEERKAIGDAWFAQEYQGEFLEGMNQVFRLSDIDRALTDDVEPLFPEVHGKVVALRR